MPVEISKKVLDEFGCYTPYVKPEGISVEKQLDTYLLLLPLQHLAQVAGHNKEDVEHDEREADHQKRHEDQSGLGSQVEQRLPGNGREDLH